MSKTLKFIVRGPFWVPFLVALLLVGAGLALRFGFSLEASTYAELAARPLPAPVAIDRYRAPRGRGAPQEAVLRLQIMTKDQIALPAASGSAQASYFVPFTTAPGGAHEGEVMGGMVLSRQARDAFVQWAVTKTHPQLANFGVQMTLAGLVETPRLAPEIRQALAAKGLTLREQPVFLTPYMGRRDAVLGARVDWVSDNPVTRLFYLAAIGMLLFGVNRYAKLRQAEDRDPEPLKGEAVRDTPFAVLSSAETSMHALSVALLADSAARAAARAKAMVERPKAPRRQVPGWVHALSWLAGSWLGLACIGWLLSEAFPQVLGKLPLVLGVLSVPLGLLARHGLQRLVRGGLPRGPRRRARWEGATLHRRLEALRDGVRMDPTGGKA